MFCANEIVGDVTPNKAFVQQYIGAVVGMDRRTFSLVRRLGVQYERQRFVRDADHVARVLSLGPRLGDDRGHPFAALAGNMHRQRIATDLWGIDADHEWVGCCRELGPGEHAAAIRGRPLR